MQLRKLRLLACVAAASLGAGCASELSNIGGTPDRALDFVMRADSFETQSLRHVVTLAFLSSAASANAPEDSAEKVGIAFRLSSASVQAAQLRLIAVTPCRGTLQAGCSDASARLPEFERLQVRLYRNQLSLAADASPDIDLGEFARAAGTGNPFAILSAVVSSWSQIEATTRIVADLLANYRGLVWARAELYAMLDETKFEQADQKRLILALRQAIERKSADLAALRADVRALEATSGFLVKVTIENLRPGAGGGSLVEHAYYPWINVISDSCAAIVKGAEPDAQPYCDDIRQNLVALANANEDQARNMRGAGAPRLKAARVDR